MPKTFAKCTIGFTHDEERAPTVVFHEKTPGGPTWDYATCDDCFRVLMGRLDASEERGKVATLTFLA